MLKAGKSDPAPGVKASLKSAQFITAALHDLNILNKLLAYNYLIKINGPFLFVFYQSTVKKEIYSVSVLRCVLNQGSETSSVLAWIVYCMTRRHFGY